MTARTTLTRASLAALGDEFHVHVCLPPSGTKNKTTSTACSLILGRFMEFDIRSVLRIQRPLVLVFVPRVFQVVEDPDLPLPLARGRKCAEPIAP